MTEMQFLFLSLSLRDMEVALSIFVSNVTVFISDFDALQVTKANFTLESSNDCDLTGMWWIQGHILITLLTVAISRFVTSYWHHINRMLLFRWFEDLLTFRKILQRYLWEKIPKQLLFQSNKTCYQYKHNLSQYKLWQVRAL